MNPAYRTSQVGPSFWYGQTWPAQRYTSAIAWVPAASAAPNVPRVGHIDPNAVEREAAASFIHNAAASAAQQLFNYLEDHSEKHPPLAQLLPLMSETVEALRTRDDARAFDLTFQVYRAIALLRAAGTELPAFKK
jgi:hypothetical protein